VVWDALRMWQYSQISGGGGILDSAISRRRKVPIMPDKDEILRLPELAGTEEVARSLDISRPTVLRLAKAGYFRYVRFGQKVIKIVKQDVIEFVEAGGEGLAPLKAKPTNDLLDESE
jgi:excisionase family DNA binding protein